MNSYVNISELTTGNSIYDLNAGQIVKINGIQTKIDNVKYGDEVEFYHSGNIRKIVVRFFEHKQVYGRQTCVAQTCVVERLTDINIGFSEIVCVDCLNVGDMIRTPSGFKKITHILQNRIVNFNSIVSLRQNIRGLIITDYHPIKKDGKWIFPIDDNDFVIKNYSTNPDEFNLYSFAIEDSESLFVNDTEIIALGHNITDDKVASHPYFGTNKVLEDIMSLNSEGHCIIHHNQIHRDPSTSLINKIA
jgi:hypothetical protein